MIPFLALKGWIFFYIGYLNDTMVVTRFWLIRLWITHLKKEKLQILYRDILIMLLVFWDHGFKWNLFWWNRGMLKVTLGKRWHLMILQMSSYGFFGKRQIQFYTVLHTLLIELFGIFPTIQRISLSLNLNILVFKIIGRRWLLHLIVLGLVYIKGGNVTPYIHNTPKTSFIENL